MGILDLVLIVVLAAIAAILSALNVGGVVPKDLVLPTYSVTVLALGYLVIKLVSAVLVRTAEPRIGATRTRGVKNIFQIVVGSAVFVAAVAILGFEVTGFLVGAGFLGIVLGLAAQQVLGNVFAGLSLIGSRPFEIGDRVTLSTSSYGLTGSTYSHESEVSGFTGVVVDIGIFYTKVIFDNGTPAVFPNSVVIGSLVINHTRTVLRTVQVRLDLDKRVDYERFKEKLLDSLREEKLIDIDKSTVEIVDAGDTTYQVKLVVWARTSIVDPVRTLVFNKALEVQRQLEPQQSADLQSPP